MNNTLEKIEAGMNNIQNIANDLKERIKIVLVSNTTDNLVFRNPIDTYGIYKENGGNCLGIVKNQFKPFGIKESFNAFHSNIIEMGADPLDIKHIEYKDGGQAKFTCLIKTFEFENGAGLNDVTEISLNMLLGFDGKTTSKLFLSTKRLICMNGMKVTKSEKVFSFRNTEKNEGKLTYQIANFAGLYNDANSYSDIVKNMNNSKVTDEQIQVLTELVSGVKKDVVKDSSTQLQNIYKKVTESIELELSRTGKNAWGLLNGITYFTNHVASGAGDEYINVNSGLVKNKLAEEFCLAI